MTGFDSDDGASVNLIEPAGITTDPNSRLASACALALLALPDLVPVWLGAPDPVVLLSATTRFCPQLATTVAIKIAASITRVFRLTVGRLTATTGST